MPYPVTTPIVSTDFALSFAHSWIEDWNQHDIDAVLSHYTDDFELTSPLILSIAGESSGVLQGKANVRAYWKKGLAQIPDLHFELKEVLTGVDCITLYYQGHRGMVTEVLWFNETGKVKKAWACYAINITRQDKL
ncbi:SnoaL-like polyketide cyclase [Synechococcus sp. PCC 7502]|nr:SnoaL-like polyketide cyclase [Synechococcus sp. PCC 7502]